MPSVQQNNNFIQALLPQYPLDEAIDWIQNNLDPDDVFTEQQLRDWAEASGFVEDNDA